MTSPTPTKTLVVLGATGNQGGAVLRYFASLRPNNNNPFRLRGLTRNTSSEAAKALETLGVEVIQADLNDAKSLSQAFEGATHVFATTDSNQHIHAASKDPSMLSPGQTPLSYAQEIEERQGRNIIEAAATTPTLQRIIYSSLEGPQKWSKGKYTKVTMFDSKEKIADLFRSTPELQDKLSLVIIGFFTRNPLNVPALYAPQKTSESGGVYELSLPMSGDKAVPMADLDADLGSWVQALFEAAPGTALTGASEVMGWAEWVETWSKTTNLPARYRRATAEEWKSRTKAAGMGVIGEAVLEEFQFCEEFGLSGCTPGIVYPEDLRKQGIEIKTTSVAEAMSKIDWSSIL